MNPPDSATEAAPWALSARNLHKWFGQEPARFEALRGIDLDVARGEFLAIMGPSGSGKSTLLNVLGGIERPDAGEVLIEGTNLATLDDDARTIARRRWMGFIFQKINLLPALSALENVMLPLLLDGVARAQAQMRATSALEAVGIAHRGEHLPQAMSGGEQQRVAIARALVIEPRLLLADEPTGSLDSANTQQVVALLRSLVDDRGHSLILVTHDPNVAAVADRTVTVRDGRLVEHGESTAANWQPSAEHPA